MTERFFSHYDARRVTNFCMLAHVDHGKTTLSDFLLTANGLLSKQLAGKVRFLDSRPDEQERLITMKASCVALQHRFREEERLVHLVDSPGHIDFSSEVSTAMRLCDGALVIVDVVDGVTMQTRSMLRLAFSEGLRTCLVVNKLDQMVTTLQLTAEEAYLRLFNIIQDCNVVLSSFVNQLEIAGQHKAALEINPMPEDEQWFHPSKGNVLFASGIDGYGFSVRDVARSYAEHAKLSKFSEDELVAGLWGQKYLDAKTMTIVDQPRRADQPNLAVQLMLEPLWSLHNVFLNEDYDEAAAKKMASKVGVPDSAWLTGRRTPREKLNCVLGRWLPLARCLLDAVCGHLPTAVEGQSRRLPLLVPEHRTMDPGLRNAIEGADPTFAGGAVAYIAKLIDTEYLAGQCQFDGSSKPLTECFVGFARVYCGTLRPGQPVTVRTALDQESVIVVRDLYLLRGQGLEPVEEVLPGCLCGIGGVLESVVKYATVSASPDVPRFAPLALPSSSIVRYAVYPKNPAELPQLLGGLQVLYRVDPQVDLAILPTGEHVMCVAGEVHGERCVEDLSHCFARVEFSVSEPLVTFRETLVGTAAKSRFITLATPGETFVITLHAVSLPPPAVDALLSDENDGSPEFRAKVEALLAATPKMPWKRMAERPALAIGPNKFKFTGTVLVDGTGGEESEGATGLMARPEIAAVLEHVVAGFQFASSSGPMAEEPLFGLAFVIDDITVQDPDPAMAALFPGQVINCVTGACRLAFEAHITNRRLVEPFYECVTYSSGATQGKIYSLLSRRRGEIVEEVLHEGSDCFHITSHVPVVESFALQDDLRIATSGAATAQLRLSHWKVMDLDPYFKPTTREEVEDFGTDVVQNIASQLLERIRLRKGIQKRNIVENAEKQKFSVRGA